MGRKRKTPKEFDALSIAPIRYSKRDFEERKKNIIDFTEAIRSRNRNKHQIELSREEVAGQYTLAVLQVYAIDDPESLQLTAQLESPACHEYWAKLLKDEPSLKIPQMTGECDFEITERLLSPALVKRYPYCVTLEHETLGLVVVPEIALRRIDQISFRKTIESTLEANTEIDSLHLYVRKIWTSIIRIVYYFEDIAAQKSKLEEMDTLDEEMNRMLEQYRLSHQHSTSHEHDSKSDGGPEDEQNEKDGESEGGDKPPTSGEGNSEEDSGRGSLSRKRQKRRKSLGGEWQELETALDLAGSAVPKSQGSRPPKNVDLPLRPKD